MSLGARCPKCGGPMEEGFLRDSSYGGQVEGTWVEGKPQRSFWSGVSMRGREQLPITSYRCEGCGYLESYARLEKHKD
jgi:hypothetical protein